jgi:hypothetical protein
MVLQFSLSANCILDWFFWLLCGSLLFRLWLLTKAMLVDEIAMLVVVGSMLVVNVGLEPLT